MRKSLSYLLAAAALSFSAPVFAADSELVVFDWGGYEDEMFFQDYMTKYGEAPTYSFFSDEEEAFQKVRAGFRADLGHPCSQSVVKWRNAGIIKPIDTSRLKNFDKVDPGFAGMEGFQVDGAEKIEFELHISSGIQTHRVAERHGANLVLRETLIPFEHHRVI